MFTVWNNRAEAARGPSTEIGYVSCAGGQHRAVHLCSQCASDKQGFSLRLRDIKVRD